jgi:PAS domain S-box-containing protein
VLGLIMDITERKIAERILLEKEEKYQALFESNIDPVCVVDAITLEIKDANSAFESIYGYSTDEMLGKSYIELSAQPIETKSAIEIGRQKGHFRVLNRIHKRKNGETFYVEGNLITHKVEGRDMLFIITHDISRRKEAEKALSERELKFRTFFESDLIGMAEISIAKQFISCNEKLLLMLGYSQNELMQKSWDQITYIDDSLVENRLFSQILTHEKENYTLEKRFICKDGSLLDCKVATKAIKTQLGTISHLIVMVDDITDRKRAELEIKESRAKLKQSQAVAKLGTIRFFNGAERVSVSDEAYEIMGFSDEKPMLTRKDLFKGIFYTASDRIETLICDIENGSDIKGDFGQAIITPNGEIRYLMANFGVSQNMSNQVTEVLVTLADITRIKKAEMALQEANAMKDQLFSIIGHDLRSPIGAMEQLINMYIANRNEYDEESEKSVLDTLSQTSKETYVLLENLLEWAKSQQKGFAPVKTDLKETITQVTDLFKGTAEAKQINLMLDIQVDKAFTFIDIEMVKTALRNLISNSIKFTPTSGSVIIGLSVNAENYVLSVSDSGVGIDESQIPILLDSNKSVSTAGTNNEKGTGLGLKLVKKFVEKNGGKLSVESIKGQGSTFTFTLPVYNENVE